MPTVKDLRAKAKEAGLTGYSSAKKDQLLKMLAEAGTSEGESSPKASTPVGVPTEANRGGVVEMDMADAEVRAKNAGQVGAPPPKNLGKPTEPDRGGVVDADLVAIGAKKAPTPDSDTPEFKAPSITGNDGKPTEPERGGVQKDPTKGVERPS